MTLDSIGDAVRRVAATAGSRPAAALQLAEEYAANPAALADLWRALGPWALLQAERATLRTVPVAEPPALPVGNSGIRKPFLDWTRGDLIRSQAFLGRLRSAVGDKLALHARLLKAMKNNHETVRDVLPRLPLADRKAVEGVARAPRALTTGAEAA